MKVWIAEAETPEGFFKRAAATRREAREEILRAIPDKAINHIYFEKRDLPGVGKLTLEKVIDLVNYMASSTEGAN